VWTVDKYHVVVDTRNDATRLEDPRGRLARPGERFEVQGRLSGAVIAASQITPIAPPPLAHVSGLLVALPPGGLIGSWTVQADSGSAVSFSVETTAVVDMRSAPAVVGARVRAVVEDAGSGRWTALSVQTDWPD
jgi:hypothetical protein